MQNNCILRPISGSLEMLRCIKIWKKRNNFGRVKKFEEWGWAFSLYNSFNRPTLMNIPEIIQISKTEKE